MHLLPRDAIVVSANRQRKSITTEKLNELASSISRNGLFHPVLVRQLDDTHYQLVAGERRLRAIDIIQANDDKARIGEAFLCDTALVAPGFIPCTLLHELPPIQLREAELEENLLRVDLTWQERDRALAELHSMRQAQNPLQTVKATAEEVAAADGRHPKVVAREITRAQIIAQHLDKPEVAAARNSSEAFYIISGQIMAEFNEALIQRQQASGTVAQSPHIFIEGDLQHVLPTFPAEHFDTIIADPPYGIGADTFGSAGSSHTYSDSAELALSLGRDILAFGYRVARRMAHLYMFCDVDLFSTMRAVAQDCGWKAFRTPLVWYKGPNQGNIPWPRLGPRRSYELILYCNKGDRPQTRTVPDVINDIPTERTSGGHAASKPVALYSYLLSLSGNPGDTVLDPCCGSGPIFPAASELFMRAVGIEVDSHYATIARSRSLGGQ